MLLSLPRDEQHKNVYIVSSDTLIENPLIKIYLNKMNELLGEAAERDGLRIKSRMVTPPANNSFWANVIGRGFPTPRMNGTFRWCTDRLKINPSAEYIREVIQKEGEEVLVLLGVRKAESIARKRRIEGRELANRLMNRHETIQDAYVYNPIVELTTDDVWDVLLRLDGGKTPWGSNNKLVSLYSDADSGECPFAGIRAGRQTQTCGNSRFGCWVCTVVIGAAYMRNDDYGIPPITALMHGGEQEFGFRAGTLAVHNIVGFGKAAEIALRDFEHNERELKRLDSMFVEAVSNMPGIRLTVAPERRLPGIINIIVTKNDFNNERFIKTVSDDLALSTGSACSAGEPSYVISAIGLEDEVSKVLRISLNKYTTDDDIKRLIHCLRTKI